MTRDFDFQLPLMDRMGFSDVYGMEDLIAEQPEEQQSLFEQQYSSGWGSLEDKPFLHLMLKWVDEE